MSTATSQFPLVDALLLTPPEGKDGFIGICTNTSAPGQVLNEINESVRAFVSVLGSLVVSRDGTERMILNSLAHPTVTYLILFSEESLTFSPSTNLLLAVQYGIDGKNKEHPIVGGKAASAHYPNLSQSIIEAFQKEIVVLPLFMYKNDYSKNIILSYLEWLKPTIPLSIYNLLLEVNQKGKIYYDSLNRLVALLSTESVKKEKGTVELDPKEFQHLQPPKVVIENKIFKPKVPFRVSKEGNTIRVDLSLEDSSFFIKSGDEFLLEYSLMKMLGEKKKYLSPQEQLSLGAEITRINAELKNDITYPSFVESREIKGETEILLQPNISLTTDKKYYYKINVREKEVSVMCLAFDVCEKVFELRGASLSGIFEWLSEYNRFEEYEMDILHRIDVGGQIGRATIAADLGYAFIQDFPNIFKINTTDLPLLITEGDNFFDIHKNTLLKLYTNGLTEEHGDNQKGLARSGVMLAIYRDTEKSLASLPALYKQGDRTTQEIREAYKAQLLRFDHDGDYSYGERTRAFFGFDQLPRTVEILKKDASRATIIERYDPVRDMSSYVDLDSGKTKYTHDPCLTHDIFFLADGKLHSFHIARAHNMVNAYPENIFGLYDAYVSTIREGLGAQGGDMYMLSSRGNILLLTEEQRTKKLLGEPSKPADDLDTISGPYQLAPNIEKPKVTSAVAYAHIPLTIEKKSGENKILTNLRTLGGVDTIEKAIEYLKVKGVMHNNPVLSEYQAGVSDPQGDQLAYFQANVMGGKVHVTAVFMNHALSNLESDKKLINHLATCFGETLDSPLGKASLFYVCY